MRRKKEFKFRGKTVEELKKLDVREFAELLRSRQRRTVLRQFNKIENFVRKARKNEAKNKPIKTHQRDLIIVPEMVGKKIGVYDGRNFNTIEIVPKMLGHVLGEFALTRQRVKHGSAGVGATKGTRALSKT